MVWEKQLCKRLGVTPAGLAALAKADAGRPVSGRGAGYAAQGAKGRLIRDGFLREIPGASWGAELEITDAGRDVVRRARAAGW